jgi:glycosyltransferase involved in cell wall biosynthesis
MKVILITNNLHKKDGWSRYSCDLVSGLKRKGIDVVTVAGKKCLASDYLVFEDPSNYIHILDILKVIVDAFKLRKIINKEKPDIIHFCVEPFINFLPFLNLGNKCKVLLTLHGSYSFFPNLLTTKIKKIVASVFYKISISKVDEFIAVSEFTKKYFLSNNGNKFINLITVVKNGVDLSNFAYSNNIKHDNKRKRILFVGEVKRRKGILESIEALKVYREKCGDDFVYDIIGKYKTDSKYFKQLIMKIHEYEMEKNIIFHGILDEADLKKYLMQADLFLMLPIMDNYKFEGFGLVYLEANAYGVPCIGSRNSGAEDAINDGVSGYLEEPDNSTGVAEKISFVLNRKLSNCNILEWAKQNSLENFVNNIIKCYNYYGK